LRLEYHNPLSTLAFNFDLRQYTTAALVRGGAGVDRQNGAGLTAAMVAAMAGKPASLAGTHS
jgi:hypothetical protein